MLKTIDATGKFALADTGKSRLSVSTDGKISIQLRKAKNQFLHSYDIAVVPVVEAAQEDGSWKRLSLRKAEWEALSQPCPKLGSAAFRGKFPNGIVIDFILKKRDDSTVAIGLAVSRFGTFKPGSLRAGLQVNIPDMYSEARTTPAKDQDKLRDSEARRLAKDNLKGNQLRMTVWKPGGSGSAGKVGLWETVSPKILAARYSCVELESERLGLLKSVTVEASQEIRKHCGLHLASDPRDPRNDKPAAATRYWHEGLQIGVTIPCQTENLPAVPLLDIRH